MNIKKITAAVLSAAIAFSVPLNVSAELSQQQLDCPDYSHIKSQTINLSKFDNTIAHLEKFAANPDDYSESEVKKYIRILIDEFTKVCTLNNAYYISFNEDVTDDAVYKRLSDSDVTYVEISSRIGDCVASLYDAGFEDALRNADGYDLINTFTYIDFEEDFSEYDDENDRLLIEIDELTNEYMSYTEEDFSVEYDGKTWILSNLFEDTLYSEEELGEIAAQINKKRNEALGNIFLEILKKRHRLAQNYGYDNFAEYAYECLFLRDYTYDEVSEVYDIVKDRFCDLSNYTYDESMDYLDASGLYDRQYSEGEIMNTVSGFLSDFNKDYSENFNHMRTHNLYCMTDSVNSSGDSFTTSLFTYTVPYVFISSADDFTDITTVVHEFGHANAEYTCPSSPIWDLYGNALDTCEIHSQGLEVLFACQNNSLFSEDEKEANLRYTLSNMIHSIIQGCLFDEFQRYAYENPDCTLDDLNEKYAELCAEYGIDYSPENYYEYDWVEITHNFDSPMYYISYATSAASVLDLWLTAMKDYDKASDIYIDFTENCSAYAPYKAAAEYAGLSTLFDTSALNDIAYQVGYYFDNDEIDADYVSGSSDDLKEYDNINEFLEDANSDKYNSKSNADSVAEPGAMIMLISFAPILIAGFICLIVLLIVVIVIVRSDKKKKKQQEQKDHFDFL